MISDGTRAAILLALESSGPRSATELATLAGVSRATASEHLSKLIEGQLILVERRSRMRFYRLASREVVTALRALDVLADPLGHAPPARPLDAPDRAARTCYDHLGGRLAVMLLAALLRERYLVAAAPRDYRVTVQGAKFLRGFGLDLRQPATHRRPAGRACLDRTERHPHLAGHVGAQLAARCLELGWIKRTGRGRAVAVTPKGRAGFRETFSVEV